MNEADVIATLKAAQDAGLPVSAVADNLLIAPSEELGKGLASAINIVFFPFHALKAKGDLVLAKINALKSEIAQEAEKIPVQNRIEPQLSVVGPALEAAKYHVEQDEIRKLFVNLIVSSIDLEKQEVVHPSFSEIIRQLSPFDVKVLRLLLRDRKLPTGSLIAIEDTVQTNRYLKSIAFSQFYRVVFPFEGMTLDNIHHYESAIQNLERLSLINVDLEHALTGDGNYDILDNHPFLQEFIQQRRDVGDNREIKFKRTFWEFTRYGKMFIECCMPDV